MSPSQRLVLLALAVLSGALARLSAAPKPAPPAVLQLARPDYGLTSANPLEVPPVGAHALRVLAPEVLELLLVTTRPAGGPIDRWDFITPEGALRLPAASEFSVRIDGATAAINAVGFKRRVLYAPLKTRDLRAASYLYLRLSRPVPEGAAVEVTNPSGALWKPEERFSARADRLRWSPAVHVNEVGYVPAFPKRAMVGAFLGSLGELELPSGTPFSVVDAGSARVVFTGKLAPRPDQGWESPAPPYQKVLEADFSALRTPGAYRLLVPGCGASYPFRIDDGAAAAFARTYALGLYHQRCGAANALPFTRFIHFGCHTAPAEIPRNDHASVNRRLNEDSENAKNNPRHTAPRLKDLASSLYPFVRTGAADVSGGHHDAGDYSKYTTNSALLIHHLVFAADALEGVGGLDNLGLPESGDGKSDFLQLARWEADFLVKLQDEDGGFSFLVYPKERRYEDNVLPDRGDPQVLYPKTTGVTASAVGALADLASSPRFRREFPADAARCLAAAKRGWEFLERALAKHGKDGAFQRITHYGDEFMHDDELAWAACALFLATGEPRYHDRLRAGYDPAARETRRYTWWRLFEAYGCAARDYAFAARTGRLPAAKLDPAYLAKCEAEVTAAGRDQANRARENAYGTSFPAESKRFRAAGWYFSMDPAFDLAAAYQLSPQPELLDALVTNMNFEGGTNPSNAAMVTGLGWRRPREIVNQYAQNDRRVLPPTGIPVGDFTSGFTGYGYGRDQESLSYPPDHPREGAYPMYDRWADTFNTTGEIVTALQARCLAAAAFLMAKTPLRTQRWRSVTARIVAGPAAGSFEVGVPGLDLESAVVLWEAEGREPVFGRRLVLKSGEPAPAWIEVEAQWPDGRRAFAVKEP
jgi:hypothetical protein